MGEFYGAKEEKGGSNLRIWQILCIVFGLLALAFLIALIVVVETQDDEVEACPSNPESRTSAQTSSPGRASIFNDLTADELKAVRDYIQRQSPLNITKFPRATTQSNHIFLIELYMPEKKAVLNYLDGSGGKPTRQARVVIHAGARTPPTVEEYLVYPAGRPDNYKKLTYPALGSSDIPFAGRASNSIENKALDALLRRELKAAESLLKRRYNDFTFTNCGKKCLWYAVSAPRHTETNNQRKVWVWFMYGLPGKVLFPVDFQIDVDISTAITSDWKISYIIIDKKEYLNVETMMKEYTSSQNFPLPRDWDDQEKLFSTFYPKGAPPVYFDSVDEGPQIYEPAGNRFKIDGRQVRYMDWSMNLRFRTSSGLQIFDINYRKKRIIYELSLQEAASAYSSGQAGLETAMFLDSGYAVGATHHEMVVGSDCPVTAAFMDILVLVDSEGPQVKKNAICVFEWNTGIPLRRHFEQNTGDGKTFYGAMETYALVVRTVATVFNNDYIFDYLFYQNGMVEVKVSTTGYLLTAYYQDSDKQYGYQVHRDLAGAIYDQYIHYKVDVDVEGTENNFEKVLVKSTNTIDKRKRSIIKNQIEEDTVDNENSERVILANLHQPMYFNIFNAQKLNDMGVKKGYRIQLGSPVMDTYSNYNSDFDDMVPWAKYPLAVTLYKETERRSSSIYNQNSARNPVVKFRDFISDNDNIDNKDLVAWVTLRLFHIPSSEDVPFVNTPGSYSHFFIRPFNYFDMDPSMNSRNVLIMKPGKVEKYTKEHEQCVPNKPDAKYEF